MFFYFIGGSLGSLIGTLMWQKLWLVWCYFNWYWVPIVRIIFFTLCSLLPKRNEAKNLNAITNIQVFLIFIYSDL